MDGFNSELESIREALGNTLGERLYNVPGADPSRFDLLEPEGGDILKELTEVVQNILGPNSKFEDSSLGRFVENGSKTVFIWTDCQDPIFSQSLKQKYFVAQIIVMDK